MASLEDFLKEPSDELLEFFTKDQLLQLASHYDIIITSSEKRLKDSVKDIIRNVLIDNGILKVRSVSLQPMVAPLSEAAIQLRLKELALQEKQLEATERERQFKEKQMYLEYERFLKEFELKTASERSTLIGLLQCSSGWSSIKHNQTSTNDSECSGTTGLQ